MSKFKKISFIIFLSASVFAAIWAYLSIKKLKSPKVESISILPDACNIYFNTKDFDEIANKINAQSLIFEKLKSFEQVQQACVLLNRFDSIFNNNEILKEELNGKLIHFALYNQSKDWLMCLNTKQTGTNEAVLEQLSLILKINQKQKDFLSVQTFDKQFVYINVSNDIISFSNSKPLLEKALTTSSAKFYKSKAYQDFKARLTENNLCNIYINTKTAKSKQHNYFFDESVMSGNLVLEPSEIKINGDLKVDSISVLAAFMNEESQPCESFINMLPSNIKYLEAYGFGSYFNLKQKLNKFYPETFSTFWKEKKELAMYNIEKNFYENLSGQLVSFETNSIQDRFIALGIQDTISAIEHLKLIFDSVITEKGNVMFKFKSGESKKLFNPLSTMSIECAAIKNNYIYLSQSLGHLYQLMDDLQNSESIEANQNFMSYKNDHFLSNFNYLVYYSPRMYSDELNTFLNFKNTGKHNPYDNLKHFSYTVVNGKNTFDFRLHLYNQAQNKGNEQNTLWTLNLDTLTKNQPFLFINHNTSENEIILQDEKNHLYLVNARGAKLWSKDIKEKIISPIYMVDIFKNDKFQILFNTEDYLHLIDRNGKDLKGFPVKLPAKATSAMSLLDYGEDRHYRIFIACNNNTIYNLNEQGKLQEGFVPVKTEKEVNLPIQYFKVGQNEYLVALDVEGKIYTFGRKGQVKIELKNKTIQDCKAFYLTASNLLATSSLIYYDDKNSLINRVNFNDKKDVVKLDIESIDANTTFNLIDENREADLLISQDKKLFVYNLNGELLYEASCNEPIDKAMYYGDETNTIYSLLSATNGMLEVNELRNQKSKTVKAANLPLILDLFNDNKIYMILSYGNQLSCVALD